MRYVFVANPHARFVSAQAQHQNKPCPSQRAISLAVGIFPEYLSKRHVFYTIDTTDEQAWQRLHTDW